MKLLELYMKAYGSFAGDETIDFGKYDKGLFVINGATGSGKSTIIDAILFALTGDAVYKDKASHHRIDASASVIRLSFEVNSRKYQVERKISNKQSSHLLREYKDGKYESAETRAVAVKEKVEDILGVKIEHLKHMLCLEQGQHLKFLTEKDRSKELFLANTFSTSRFEKFQKRIYEKYKEQTKSVENLVLAIENLLSSLDMDSKERLDASVKELELKLNSSQENLEKLSTQESNLLQTLAHAKKQQAMKVELETSTNELSTLNSSKEKIEDDRKAVKEIECALAIELERKNLFSLEKIQKEKSEKLNSSELFIDKLIKQLEEAKYQQLIDLLDGKIKKLTPQKEKIERDLDSLVSYKSIDAVLTKSRLEVDHLTSSTAKLTSELVELQSLTNKVSNLLEISAMLKVDKSRVDDVIKRRESLEGKNLKFKQLTRDIEEIEKNLAVIKPAIEDLEITSKSLLDAKTLEVISDLQSKLQPGDACLVCGSKEHHHAQTQVELSKFTSENKDLETRLIKLKKEELDLEKMRTSISAKLEVLTPDISELSALDSLDALMDKKSYLQRKENDIQEKIRTSKKADDDFLSKKEDLNKLQLSLQSALNLRDSSEEKIKLLNIDLDMIESEDAHRAKLRSLNDEIAMLQKEKDNAIGTHSSLSTQLSEARKLSEELRPQIKDLSEEIDHCERAVKDKLEIHQMTPQMVMDSLLKKDQLDPLKSGIQEYDKSIYSLKKRISHLEQSIDEKNYDVESIETLAQKKKDELIACTQNHGLIVEKLSNQSLVKNKIKEKEELLGDKQNVIAELKKLFDVVNGKNKSMGLHRWILASVLDEILLRASEVLDQFMPSRYRLIRQGVSDDKAISLEVEVIDLITGKSRKIRTLSGGEGFIVSLAFSLGLALVLSDKKSFIDVEALFIDEGFGSLDSESLVFVLNVLRRLSDGKKMIGLITHVDMVKEFVSKSINVVPASEVGSTLTFG